MKIGILEWLCGGGLGPVEHIDGSLLVEGQAMLACLVQNLVPANFEVAIVLDERLEEFRHQLHPQASIQTIPRFPSKSDVFKTWANFCQQVDLTLVIAPEIDQILCSAVQGLMAKGVALANCTGTFLDLASNKLAMAQALMKYGIMHPPTCQHAALTQTWMAQVQLQFENDFWVLKPMDGAGCEHLARLSTGELRQTLENPREDRMLVQPWVPGTAYSCSALIDKQGIWHWMPLVTQEFTPGPYPKYLGGELLRASLGPPHPIETLQPLAIALGETARGWVGVDLVYDYRREVWYVIEINPRCTTSMIGLQAAYSGNLAASLITSQLPSFAGLTGQWQTLRFRANGTVQKGEYDQASVEK